MALAGLVDAFLEAWTTTAGTITAGATALGADLAGLAGTTLTDVFLEILSLEGAFAIAFLRREEVETLGEAAGTEVTATTGEDLGLELLDDNNLRC